MDQQEARNETIERRSDFSKVLRAIIPPLAVAVLTGAGSAWVSTWVGYRLLDQRVTTLELTNAAHVNEKDIERLEKVIAANAQNITAIAALQHNCRETVIALQKTIEFYEKNWDR